MNIFYLSSDPVECASMHCDKHVVKMVLETAQLLSTAHHVLDGELAISGIYKATHVKHPCAVWVCQSESHYDWTVRLLRSLLFEYTHRYGKEHKTTAVYQRLRFPPFAMEHMNDLWQEPPQCMPAEYKCSDTVTAYRAYYISAKAHLLTYKNRNKPNWIP